LRPAAEGPDPRTGRVHDDEVIPAGHIAGPGRPVRRVRRPDTRARGPRAQLGELVWVDVARVDGAASLHLLGQEPRLVAMAGAGVQHAFARARAGEERDDLRALLLDD